VAKRAGDRRDIPFAVLFACWLRTHPSQAERPLSLAMWPYLPKAISRLNLAKNQRLPRSLASQSGRPATKAERALRLASDPLIQTAAFLAACDPVTFLDWWVTGDRASALSRSLSRYLTGDAPPRPFRGVDSPPPLGTEAEWMDDQAVAELLARLRATGTPAEVEVAEMRATGLKFVQIAAQRGGSASTARVLAWRLRRKMAPSG
jgi:hypothetical protein